MLVFASSGKSVELHNPWANPFVFPGNIDSICNNLGLLLASASTVHLWRQHPAYWISTFCRDFMVYIVPFLLTICLIWAFQVDIFWGWNAVSIVWKIHLLE